MDLNQYRATGREQERIQSLLALIPTGRTSVLDVGARDGYISRRLTHRFELVTALDLEKPSFTIDRVKTVKGDVTSLDFADAAFDSVLCAEVLEHIPPAKLQQACNELARVAKYDLVIGVPYRQDTRIARSTCLECGERNPPSGHVNTFDQVKLHALFRHLQIARVEYVGSVRARTNALSVLLMDLAGNPWGTYDQDEPCIRCGTQLRAPARRSLAQKVCGRVAVSLNQIQERFTRPAPNWIHVLFQQSAIGIV